MRQLTAKQKKVLREWMKANPDEDEPFECERIVIYKHPELVKKLEEINDTEILEQEAWRFVRDERLKEE
jgi:hypothetical protein